MNRIWIAAMAALACSLPTVTARAELITNGSFEMPTVPGGNYTDFAGGSTAITGWTVAGNDVLLINSSYSELTNGITAFNAADGNQAVDVTGAGNTGPTDGIFQTVATTAGTTYVLSFDIGTATSDPAVGPNPVYEGPAIIGLSFDGGVTRVNYSNTNTTPGSINWEQFTVSFVATGSSTTIGFYDDTSATSNYAGLDAVSLVAVPEPASLIATSSALLLVGGFYSLRKRLHADSKSPCVAA